MPKTKKTVKIDQDLECVFISALRYCMGRRTYMPKLVMDVVTPLLPSLSDNFLNVVTEDLKSNIFWGDECDKKDWDKFGCSIAMEQERRLMERENN